MDKKEAVKTIKNLEGEYEIELKLIPLCCKKPMEKVYDWCNNNWFYFCRTCGKIKNDVK